MTRTLGVVGTLVWDRFVDPSGGNEAFVGWGGIAYSLASLAVALPHSWTVRPIVKLGSDLAEEGRRFVARCGRADVSALKVVPEPNNRVELRYLSSTERRERLSGGVPSWTWEELAPRLAGCDALFVNFVSGHEMGLETAAAMAEAFDGPTYCDLHSLFLGIGPDGTRIPRPLSQGGEWAACFDAVQLNETELALSTGTAEPWSLVPPALPAGPLLFAVTLGPRGAACAVGPDFDPSPDRWRPSRGAARPATEIVTVAARPERGDPTGCGDVWGAAMFARLLAGDGVERAMAEANRLGRLNVGHRSVEGLVERFRADGAPGRSGQGRSSPTDDVPLPG